MPDVLREARVGTDGIVQLLQFPADTDHLRSYVDVRFKLTAADDWEDGWGELDWPPVQDPTDPRLAYAFDAIEVSDEGPVIFFGVGTPGAGCSLVIGDLTIALTGPTLIVDERRAAPLVFHGPAGRKIVVPRG